MSTADTRTRAAILDDLMKKAFGAGREPRSSEYQQGVLLMLERRLGGTFLQVACPYAMGSASADAFLAGQEEGRAIFQTYSRRDS